MQLIPVPLFVNQEARLHCQVDNDCFHYLSFPDSLNGAFYLIPLSPYPSLVTAFFFFCLQVYFLTHLLKTWMSCFLLFVLSSLL